MANLQLLSTMPVIPLNFGCRVVWEAIDPGTGAHVTGVVIKNATLYGYDLSTGPAPEFSPPVAPGWVPLPVEPPAAGVGGG